NENRKVSAPVWSSSLLNSHSSLLLPMDTYLVAYDICHPKRLRKVARVCEDFGLRNQYSVFLCRLTAHDLVRLQSRLYNLINLQEDQVIFVPICNRDAEQM